MAERLSDRAAYHSCARDIVTLLPGGETGLMASMEDLLSAGPPTPGFVLKLEVNIH